MGSDLPKVTQQTQNQSETSSFHQLDPPGSKVEAENQDRLSQKARLTPQVSEPGEVWPEGVGRLRGLLPGGWWGAQTLLSVLQGSCWAPHAGVSPGSTRAGLQPGF